MLRRVWTRRFPLCAFLKISNFIISSSTVSLRRPHFQHCLTHVSHSRNVYTHSYMCTLRHHRHCRSHAIRCNIISKTYLPNRKLLQPRFSLESSEFGKFSLHTQERLCAPKRRQRRFVSAAAQASFITLVRINLQQLSFFVWNTHRHTHTLCCCSSHCCRITTMRH